MKIKLITSAVFSLVCVEMFFACSTPKQAAIKRHELVVTNPSSIERADELIVLSREMIEQKIGNVGDEKYVSITKKNDEPVIAQHDDLNKDGRWDEVAFIYKFEPKERAVFYVSQTSSRLNKAVVRAHVRMQKKNADNSFGPSLDSVSIPAGTPPTDFSKQKLPAYLTEGPAWENDKVAFRLYMDTRNTKDIFGKTTQRMVMDAVGVNPNDSYHNFSEWGMDILAVGKSLGAGSLALSIPNINGKDTLVRLGGANVELTTFEKVADGPVRAILRMHYRNWQAVNGIPPINITEEISIWGGKYFYESKVTVNNAPQGAKLVTGIVNLKSKKLNEFALEDSKVLYTYDTQSENKDKLGMAVMVRSKHFSAFGATPNSGSDILNTYTAMLPVSSEPSEFRFYAGWELSDLLFTKEESFRIFLNTEAIKYSVPMVISW